jgi:hypothetical protein
MKISKRNYLALILIVVLFLGVWYLLASNLTAWSDEIGHMATAKGLMETGTFARWDFDKGENSGGYATRGKIISYLTMVAYRVGGFSFLSSRMVPLIFTLLTFATFALYIKIRQKAGIKEMVLAGIFFLGQSMVLEKSLYVRTYAPLGFLMILTMITLWEGIKKIESKKYTVSAALLIVSLVLIAIPTIDTWQYQQFITIIFAIAVYYSAKNENILNYIRNNKKLLLIMVPLVLITAPLFVVIANLIVARLPIGNRLIGSSFSTYWDNIAGLVRYGWALNICFIGMFIPIFGKKHVDWDFNSWLFLSGILSGLFIGLYDPHNFIFWSRFFYVPVVLTVLGFSGMLSKLIENKNGRNQLIILYLLLNMALSFTTFYYDRSNIRKPITWLNGNLGTQDVLLVFSAELGLHGGEKLTKYAYPIRPSQDPEDIRKLIKIIDRPNVKDIYFLYTDHHAAFREKLYIMTTGDEWRQPPADPFRYLRSCVPGKQVMEGLRGCGLIRYKKDVLVADLRNLLKNGYQRPYIRIEKRMALKMKRLIWPKVKENAGSSQRE